MIIDGHQDIAWNMIGIQRNFLDSVFVKRNSEGPNPLHGEGIATVGYPEVKAANIRVVFSTIWVQPENSIFPAQGPRYKTTTDAYYQAINQLHYYENLEQSDNSIRIVKTKGDLIDVVSCEEYKLGLVLLMEGADPIRDADQLQEWFLKGLRIIGPAWQTNKYVGGAEKINKGLTSPGRKLLQAVGDLGMVLDTAHMSERGMLNCSDVFPGIMINSHSNCRSIVPGERQLSDVVIKLIASTKGVIGIMPWGPCIKPDYSDKQSFVIDDVVLHISHICDLTGSSDNVGIGSSFDGGFGLESIPKGMDNIVDLPKLGDVLSSRGFSTDDIEKILYKNWYQVLIKSLPDNQS